MKRREAIRTTSIILGYAVSASAVTGIMAGCRVESGSTTEVAEPEVWSPDFFNDEQISTVAELAETILPRTATPGAKDAGVHQFIDMMMKDYYPVRDQKEFIRGLEQLDQVANQQYGNAFVSCSPEERLAMANALDRQAYDEVQKGDSAAEQMPRPFFAIFKELTWTGFFTSQLIGEEYLNYDPIPGAYHGCMPIEETGSKTWSL